MNEKKRTDCTIFQKKGQETKEREREILVVIRIDLTDTEITFRFQVFHSL